MPDFTVQEKSLDFQGLRLAYREWLRSDEEASTVAPVLALHGWMDNAGTFDALIPLLDAGRILALDFSGHGLSSHRSRDADYYIWVYVEEILALLDHAGIERVHLLAHSMGGAVACVFSALYPGKVISQCLLDIAGPITTPEAELPEQMRTAISARETIATQAIRHYSSVQAARQSRANRGISIEAATALGERGIARDELGWYWSVDRQLARRHLLSLSEAQCEVILRANHCPTQIITAAGTWDHRRDLLNRRLALFPRLDHHELDGSHFQHLEGRVGEVAVLVGDFLSATTEC